MRLNTQCNMYLSRVLIWVLDAYAHSEDSGEPVHSHCLARDFIVLLRVIQSQMTILTKHSNCIPYSLTRFYVNAICYGEPIRSKIARRVSYTGIMNRMVVIVTVSKVECYCWAYVNLQLRGRISFIVSKLRIKLTFCMVYSLCLFYNHSIF